MNGCNNVGLRLGLKVLLCVQKPSLDIHVRSRDEVRRRSVDWVNVRQQEL